MLNLLLNLVLINRATPAVPSVLPIPARIVFPGSGAFVCSGPVALSFPESSTYEGAVARRLLERAGAKVVSQRHAADKSFALEIANPPILGLGGEGYSLEVGGRSVAIRANTSVGLFYGLQTVRQLLPAEMESQAVKAATIPSISIADQPRFPWRGMMLDVSRHFFPAEDVKHVLDLMAMQKMNVFHWHLVDDGGWRLQIRRYPNLTDQGAWRRPSAQLWDYPRLDFPPKSDRSRRYGGFYTQAQVRDIVRYASARHITIIPEIEMPGHSLAALASYPELACRVTDQAFMAVSGMPHKNVYCAGKDSTFDFVEHVLDEVFELFPSKLIHIGGDEVDKYLWNNCPDCKARMASENLKDAEQLQSYFIKRIEKYVNGKGHRIIGWDEILQGGLAPNAAVMSWRGTDGGVQAATEGHDVVMSPTSHCYFDYPYDRIPTEHVLSFDPVPAAIAGKPEAGHILGGQCNLWTEMVSDRKTVEQRLFPRILAMANVLWSQPTTMEAFGPALDAFFPRLQALNLNFYLPKPEAEFDAVILDPNATVSLKSPMTGATIRYTTDGTVPTKTSRLYTGPLSAATPQVITAISILPSGQQSDPTHVEVASQTIDSTDGLLPGFAYTLYDGMFTALPDFTTLKSVSTGTAPKATIPTGKGDFYGIDYVGVITVPTAGNYRFYLRSDDGSALWIGGAKLVDNDGLHAAIEQSGRMHLPAGSYPIRIAYFNATGGQSLVVSIEGPGIPKQDLPSDWIRHR